MTPREKLLVARQLQRPGSTSSRPGFPAASAGDFVSVRQIAKEIRDGQSSHSQGQAADIDCAWEALKEAADRRLHVSHLHILIFTSIDAAEEDEDEVLKEASDRSPSA